jgi:hypothetical protein
METRDATHMGPWVPSGIVTAIDEGKDKGRAMDKGSAALLLHSMMMLVQMS